MNDRSFEARLDRLMQEIDDLPPHHNFFRLSDDDLELLSCDLGPTVAAKIMRAHKRAGKFRRPAK